MSRADARRAVTPRKGGLVRHVVDWWDQLPVLRLRLRFEPQAPFRIREFPGSMFRGAFGNSLKHLMCVRHHRQDCEGCDLVRSCAYTRVFEPRRAPTSDSKGPANPPRAFLLEWPPGSDDRCVGCTPHDLEVVLLAHATTLSDLIAPAFAEAARRGFGSDRIPHRLTDVTQVFVDGTVRAGASEPERLGDYAALGVKGRAWRIRTVTPWRIEEQKRLVERPTLEQILRSIERRLRLLAQTHQDAAPARIEHEWFHQARDVEVRSCTWERRHWERFSARQHKRVPNRGVLGELRLRGEIAPFASLLRAATIVHLGKSTSFGMGRVAVEADEEIEQPGRADRVPRRRGPATGDLGQFDAEGKPNL